MNAEKIWAEYLEAIERDRRERQMELTILVVGSVALFVVLFVALQFLV